MNDANTSSAGNVPQDAADNGNVPQPAADFGTMPQTTASFGMMQHHSEKSENHTITVREAARHFESAGVARIERSIVNWCQPNKQGVTRLDCYFDPNERKYYITPQSIERAIQEEKAKIARHGEPLPHGAETARETAHPSQQGGTRNREAETTVEDKESKSPLESSEPKADHARELEREVMDLRIANRGKDYFIERLEKIHEQFAVERQGYVERLIQSNRKVGELETRLLQLDRPRSDDGRRLEVLPEDAPASNDSAGIGN